MTISSLLTLNNGARMPALGFGTLDRTAPERIAGAVEAAIATGYRLVDTAASYAVERQVGEGIRRSGIARSCSPTAACAPLASRISIRSTCRT
jgi:diketogulonate reductase-like aldo/keto reductase